MRFLPRLLRQACEIRPEVLFLEGERKFWVLETESIVRRTPVMFGNDGLVIVFLDRERQEEKIGIVVESLEGKDREGHHRLLVSRLSSALDWPIFVWDTLLSLILITWSLCKPDFHGTVVLLISRFVLSGTGTSLLS